MPAVCCRARRRRRSGSAAAWRSSRRSAACPGSALVMRSICWMTLLRSSSPIAPASMSASTSPSVRSAASVSPVTIAATASDCASARVAAKAPGSIVAAVLSSCSPSFVRRMSVSGPARFAGPPLRGISDCSLSTAALNHLKARRKTLSDVPATRASSATAARKGGLPRRAVRCAGSRCRQRSLMGSRRPLLRDATLRDSLAAANRGARHAIVQGTSGFLRSGTRFVH